MSTARQSSVIATTPVFRHSPEEIFSETSIMYMRTDGRKVAMSLQHTSFLNAESELIIESGNEEERSSEHFYERFTGTVEEARILRDLLNSPEVAALLGIEEGKSYA